EDGIGRFHVTGVQTCALPISVCGGHGRGDLTDHLVGVVDLQGAGRQERGQLGGVGEPFVYDVDDVVLLDGVQDLDEAGVAQQGGGACRGQDGAGPCVVRGQDVRPDGAAELLVHGTPTAESVQTGDALLEAVA